MALRETLELDLSQAQADIDRLEQSLDSLSTTISVESRGLDRADDEAEDLRKELDRVEDSADRVARRGPTKPPKAWGECQVR
jgi:chromosome segregation ATPase